MPALLGAWSGWDLFLSVCCLLSNSHCASFREVRSTLCAHSRLFTHSSSCIQFPLPFPCTHFPFPCPPLTPFPAVDLGWHVAETDHAVYVLGFSGYGTFESHSCHSCSVLCCLFMSCSLPFGNASTSVGALQLPKCLWGPSLLSDYEGAFVS